MARFFNYKDIDFRINGSIFYAEQVSLSAQASVEPVILSDGTFLNYAPKGAVVGNLSCDFYLNGSFPSFLDVTNTDESAVTVSFAGITINNVFLKNVSFSVEPFQPVLISAEFDWYSNILFENMKEQSNSARQSKPIPSYIAHSYKSYIDQNNFYPDDPNDSLGNVVSFSYSTSCDRPIFLKVDQTIPFRCAKLNKNISVDLSANNLGKIVTTKGKNISTIIYLKDFYGQSLSTFSINGVMTSQSYSVSSGNYMLSQASIEKMITEEKVLV